MAVEAEKITRTSPNLEYALGVAALAAENLRGAADHLEAALSYAGRVLSIAPFEGVTGPLSLNTLSEVRYLQGESEASFRLFSDAAALSDGEPVNAFFGPASTLIRQGDPGWAVFLLSMAVRLLPQDAYPLKRGGELLFELGLFEKSVGWLENARKLSPGDSRITDLLEEALSRHHPV